VITVAPAGGKAGLGAVVAVGAVAVEVPGDTPEPPGVGDGREVVVERPEPPGGPEDARVVLVDGTGPLVVVDGVEVEVVEGSVSESGEVVVVVVSEGSVVVVVVVVVVGSDGSVVVVGSPSARSAPAGAAGSQTRVVKTVVRARARPTRCSNARLTRSTSGRNGRSSPNGMFQNDDGETRAERLKLSSRRALRDG
jgi:hypothetical protein